MPYEAKTKVSELSAIPQTSGVYFFLGKRNGSKASILYVGKATNLRSRVRSYFAGDLLEKRGPLVASMLELTKSIGWLETDSVLEALVTEAHFIKKYQPVHNTDQKSDKSFVYLIITKEAFPRLLIKREREIFDKVNGEAKEGGLGQKKVVEPIKYSFGPFTSRHTLEQALKIIRKIFPFYSKKHSYDAKSNVYQQIGLAPGTGMGEKEYMKNIKHIKLFFEGKKKRIVGELEKSMMQYAKAENFEKAEEIKRRLYALQHIRDVALTLDDAKHSQNTGYRVEAYDVAHLQGKHAVGVMTVLYDGHINKNEYRKFKIKSFSGIDDNRALQELLERRFAHREWEMPKLIVADGSVAQKGTVSRFLREQGLDKGIKVVACRKDEHHKVAEILGESAVVQKHRTAILLANSEAHRFAISYHKQVRSKAFIKKKK